MEKLIVGKSLENQLDTVIKELAPTGNISYVVLQFDDEEEPTIIASKGEDTVHSSASLIKVLIMEYVFHLARTEQLDLNDTVPLSRTPRVEGGGALQELVAKHSFTYLELCRLMMVLSDNIATNLLITVLGMENINARAEKLGVDEIVRRNVEQRNKKRAKKGLPPEKIAKNATTSTKKIDSETKSQERIDKLQQKKEQNDKKVKEILEATNYYKSAKPGSLAEKAGMVAKYNEKNSKKN